MGNKLSQKDFLQRAKFIHCDKYNYNKINYINSRTKVVIICPNHGEFLQRPLSHLKGHGCPNCGKIDMKKTKELTLEQFIEKAKTVHGDKYEYNKVIYKGNATKIIITCLIHGDFNQTPLNHLNGQGCFYCYLEKRKSNNIEFIKKAKVIHGDRFNYSKVNYVKSKIKVTIVCPDHGEFYQTPNNHLKGIGCPVCSASKGELTIKAILEKNNIKYIQEYKLPEIVSKLEYDFYLPDYNLLIEFHGKQHYEYSPFFHCNDEDNFLKQKDRDIIKKYLAYNFKYKFLEFNYKQLDNLSEEEFSELVLEQCCLF